MDTDAGNGTDAESEISMLEALSHSEKFENGDITFDWRKLPPHYISALPDPPPSAKKYLQRRLDRHAREEQREKEVQSDRQYIENKLASWREDRSGTRSASEVSNIRKPNKNATTETGTTSGLLDSENPFFIPDPEVVHVPGRDTAPSTPQPRHTSPKITNVHQPVDSHQSNLPLPSNFFSSILPSFTFADIQPNDEPSRANDPDPSTHVTTGTAATTTTTTSAMTGKNGKAKGGGKDKEKRYTFNNCQFTYAGKAGVVAPPLVADKEEGLLKTNLGDIAHNAMSTGEKRNPDPNKFAQARSRTSTGAPFAHDGRAAGGEAAGSNVFGNPAASVAEQLENYTPIDLLNDAPPDELTQLLNRLHASASASQQHISVSPNAEKAVREASLSRSRSASRGRAAHHFRASTEESEQALSVADLRSREGSQILHRQNPSKLSREHAGRPSSQTPSVQAASNASTTRSRQQKLFHIHDELSALATHLKKERTTLDAKNLDLAAREQALKAREAGLVKEIERLVKVRLVKKEEAYKQDADLLVEKYNEMLGVTQRENKRLQVSLKDLVTTNRQLREQIQQWTARAVSAEHELEARKAQLKQARDRNTRMKTTLNGVATRRTTTASPKKSGPSVADLIKLMQGQQQKAAMRPASTQTDTPMTPNPSVAKEYAPASSTTADLSSGTSPLTALENLTTTLLRLRSEHQQECKFPHPLAGDVGGSHAAVAGSMSYLVSPGTETASDRLDHGSRAHHPASGKWKLAVLPFIIECLLFGGYSVAQKYVISAIAYEGYASLPMSSTRSLSNHGKTKHTTKANHRQGSLDQKIKLMLALVVLAGIARADIQEQVMDAILNDLSQSDSAKLAFLSQHCLDIILPFLHPTCSLQLRLLTSSLLLLFCVPGPVQERFVSCCGTTEVVDALANGLEGSDKQTLSGTADEIGVLENVVVALHKVAGVSHNAALLRDQPTLIPRLRSLLQLHSNHPPATDSDVADRTSVSMSTSGALTHRTRGETEGSEFLCVNIQAVLCILEQY